MSQPTTTSKPAHDTLFISYRRTDAFAVDHLMQALAHEFGSRRLVQDTVSFEPGANFPQEIAELVSQCALMLVVIGPGWHERDGDNLLMRPDDWVRREVELALQTGRPLVPVLLGGATLPQADQLPQNMQPLLARNALRLRTGVDAPGDMRRIVAAAGRYMPRDWRRVARELSFGVLAMAAIATAASSLAARTFFSDYLPWQWPNVLTGLAASLLVPALALAFYLGRLWSALWRKPRPLYRQPALVGLALAGLVVTVTATLIPYDDGVIDSLYESLESTRVEVARVREQLAGAQTRPRHAASEDLRLVAHVLQVRAATTLTEDGTNLALNNLAPYRQDPSPRRRLWATLMSAEALRFTRKHDEQLALYRKVAQDEHANSWQRWYAWQEVGSIALSQKDDAVQARVAWEEALRHRKSRGLFMNLAVLDENAGNWPGAEARYVQAEQHLKAYMQARKLATLADQEAGIHSNWCNMLRKQALLATDGAPALREGAIARCRMAIAAYTPYLDAYWNLARVEMDAGRLDDARSTLQAAFKKIAELSRASPELLNRFGYDVYGDRYTVWLMVVERFRAGWPLAHDAMLASEFRRLVVQLDPSPTHAVKDLLAQLKALDLTVQEDEDILARMTAARYL